MFDALAMLRAASAGNLTADFTSTFLKVPPPANEIVCLRFVIPTMGANDTINPYIRLSDDGIALDLELPLPTISEPGEYFWKQAMNGLTYLGVRLDTVDSGGGFNAGAVEVGIVPSASYTGKWLGESQSI